MYLDWFLIIIAVTLSLGLIYYIVYLTRPSKKEVDHPFPSSHIVEIKGHKIHYLDAGNGPILLLLHGIGASSFIWRNLIPLLQNKFRIIAIDLPGFGYSSKNPKFSHNLEDQAYIIDKTIDKLGLQNLGLVGSSMGGAIALWLKKKHPKKYHTTIVISPATNPRHTKRMKLSGFNLLGNTTSVFLTPFIMKKILARVTNKTNLLTPEVIQEYLRPYKEDKNSIHCFTKAFDNLLGDKRMPKIFSSLEAPIHILWGKKDRITKYKYARELVRTLPNAKLYTLDDGSHHLMEDNPEWTAKKIIEITNQSPGNYTKKQ